MEYAARIILSTIPVGLFFALYFRNFVFQRSILWQSKAFFLGMLSSIAAIVIQALLPETASPAVRSFFHAALVEEAIRFTVLYLRIRKSSEGFTVTEGIFDGILVALGFAFSENLHYSATTSGYVI
ncbi:MAG TPA: PrsW family glutamic-type intramembrane protease, partial [Leptospiraceae bacterium]|nr:PrsW family glutamic-type intramembrane protease [Leptospiraceae bacterium]